MWYAGFNYFYKHRRSHLDPEWAKQNLKHHYDHHMGRDQDANWCVTQPWFDYLMGTRIDYEYDEQGKPLKRPAPTLDQVTLDGTAENAADESAEQSAA